MWAVGIHGGAGIVGHEVDPTPYIASLDRALRRAVEVLRKERDPAAQSTNTSLALKAAIEAVVSMEDDEVFNAGRGAVLNANGEVEMDAAVMDGRDMRCGTCAGVKRLRNPVLTAEAVLANTSHITLSKDGAEALAGQRGLPFEKLDYFVTEERSRQLKSAKSGLEVGTEKVFLDHDLLDSKKVDAQGTVGAVVLDPNGDLAVATSTGGMTNKMVGRVGDTPVIGAGLYANKEMAVCATGQGEAFMRQCTCARIGAAMEYGSLSLQEAAYKEVHGKLQRGDGGVIAVDTSGNLVFEFVSRGMFRAMETSSGKRAFGVWKDWM